MDDYKKERVVSIRVICMNKMKLRNDRIYCAFLFFFLFLALSNLSAKQTMNELTSIRMLAVLSKRDSDSEEHKKKK